MKNELVLKEEITEIKDLVVRGVQAWAEAGSRLVRLLDDGHQLDQLAEQVGFSQDILTKLVAVGRGHIHPDLLLHTSPAAQMLLGCDVSEQRRYIEQPLELMVLHDDQPQTLQVKLDALTPDQARQVIDRDHVRDLAEQRAWLESQLAKQQAKRQAAVEDEGNFVIKGHKVLFKQGASMTKDELIKIAARL